MATASWTLMRPIDETDIECMAGNECSFPQEDGRPGIAFGYWTNHSIHVRACSRECAEKVIIHIHDRFKSMEP